MRQRIQTFAIMYPVSPMTLLHDLCGKLQARWMSIGSNVESGENAFAVCFTVPRVQYDFSCHTIAFA